MLTMPSVSSLPSPNTARPVLVADAVRPALPVRAIEPTTAISKERSRAENKAPDISMAAASAVYTPSGMVAQIGAASQDRQAGERARSAAQSERNNTEQPPVEKSEIQKALEAQVKDLLSNVWKASAKAVDFLLQRDPKAAEKANMSTAEDVAQRVMQSSDRKGEGRTTGNTPGVSTAVPYTPQGGQQKDTSQTAGQLLDVLA